MSCLGAARHVHTRKKFTSADITAQSFLEDRYSLYGTSTGHLYLYNFDSNITQLLATIQGDEIHSIVSYNREAFLGTRSGRVFVVNLINRTSAVLGQLQHPVLKVYIFGDGASRMIYAATDNGRISAFQYSTARLSFGDLTPVMQSQVKEVKANYMRVRASKSGTCSKEIVDPLNDAQESSDSQDTQSTPSSLNLLALDYSTSIKPVWTKKFHNARPTFLHGCDDVLAFCSEDGSIRFFSLMNFAKMMEFTYGDAFPACCYLHRRIVKGQNSLFCVVGYSNGAVYTIDVTNAIFTRSSFDVVPEGSVRAIYYASDVLFVCDDNKIYVFNASADVECAYAFRRPQPYKLEFGESARGVVLCLTYTAGQCAQVLYEAKKFEELFIGK